MNIITIVGNVGSDPELKYTKTGKPLVTMSIATTRKVKDETETTWHHVECWSELAENVAASILKGTRVIVMGRIAKQEFQTTSGEDRTKTVLVAHDVAPSLMYQTMVVERNER